MHLPWMQIDEDAHVRAEHLGRLLGVTGAHGVGIAVAIWRWAFRVAPKGDFSGRVDDIQDLAAAAEWPLQDADRLAQALQKAGIVATTPYLRVRGLDRYRSAVKRNASPGGKKAKPADSRTHAAGSAQNGSGTHAGSAQPDADVEADADADAETATAGGSGSPQATPQAVENLSDSERQVWLHIQHAREGLSLPREATIPRRFRSWCRELKEGGISFARWDHALATYLSDPAFRPKQWPTAVFITDAVWRLRLPR